MGPVPHQPGACIHGVQAEGPGHPVELSVPGIGLQGPGHQGVHGEVRILFHGRAQIRQSALGDIGVDLGLGVEQQDIGAAAGDDVPVQHLRAHGPVCIGIVGAVVHQGDAVIVAVPAFTPVTTPSASTVATLSSLEDQVTLSVLSDGVRAAASVVVSPTVTFAVDGLTLTAVAATAKASASKSPVFTTSIVLI